MCVGKCLPGRIILGRKNTLGKSKRVFAYVYLSMKLPYHLSGLNTFLGINIVSFGVTGGGCSKVLHSVIRR